MNKKLRKVSGLALAAVTMLGVFPKMFVTATDDPTNSNDEIISVERYKFMSDSGKGEGPYEGAGSESIPLWRYNQDFVESKYSKVDGTETRYALDKETGEYVEDESGDFVKMESGRFLKVSEDGFIIEDPFGVALENSFFRTNDLEEGQSVAIYCLDLGKKEPEKLRKGPELEIKYQRILESGYPAKAASEYEDIAPGLKDYEFEWATATALKIASGKGYTSEGVEIVDGGISLGDFGSTESGKEDGKLIEYFYNKEVMDKLMDGELPALVAASKNKRAEQIKDLVEVLVAKQDDESIVMNSMSLNDQHVEQVLSDDETTLKAGPYIIEAQGKIEGLELEVVSSKDFTILDENGEVFETKANEPFYIETEVKAGDEFNYEVKVNSTTKTYFKYLPVVEENPEAYQEMAIASKELLEDISKGHFKLAQKFDFNFKKVDKDTQEAMSDVVFKILDAENKTVLMETKSDDEGNVEFKDLLAGEYILREELVEGYMRHKDMLIKLADDGTLFVDGEAVDAFVVENEKVKFVFEKVDEAGEALEGAVFEVVDSEGNKVDVKVDGNKYLLEGLKEGEYIIKEIEAPLGYVADSTAAKLVIDENGEGKLSLENNQFVNKLNNIKVVKRDAVNKDALEGAVFELRYEGEAISEATSNEDGELVFEKLMPGSYEIVETEAPKGYVLGDKTFKFEVNKSGQVVDSEGLEVSSVLFLNSKTDEPTPEPEPEHKYTIVVNKVDGQTEDKLEGVEFELVNVDTGEATKSITDENGRIAFTGLDKGKYELKETKPLDGYILLEDSLEFVLNEDTTDETRTVVTSVENFKEEQPEEPLYKLVVNKIDGDTEDKLEGVKFGLANQETGVVIESITDENGRIAFTELEAGKYILTELETLEGYELLEDSLEFVINEDTANETRTVVTSVENFKTVTPDKPAEEVQTGDSTLSQAPFIIGTMAVATAAVGFIFFKKRSEESK